MSSETLTEDAALPWLYHAATAVSADQAIVELGVYRGGSLVQLIDGAANGNGAPVYGVDAWGSVNGVYSDRPHMLDRYTNDDKREAERITDGRCTLVHDLTTSAARCYDGPPIGLLYIDAEHKLAAVLADFRAWQPHLAPSAVVAFDDYEPGRVGRGVMQAVQILLTEQALTWQHIVGMRLAVTTLT